MKSKVDIDSIIDYYNGVLAQFQQLHFYKEGQKNSSTSNLFLWISAFLTAFLIVTSILVPVYLNRIDIANSNINQGFSNLIQLAQNNSTINKMLINTTAIYLSTNSDYLVQINDSSKYLLWFAFVVLGMLLVAIISNGIIVWSYNKELNENAEELGRISKNKVYLYLIKAKYPEKLTDTKVKEKLLLFYLPFGQYETELNLMVGQFEHETKIEKITKDSKITKNE